jgi:ectoine hydroxylase-related dioxygenase (phytanoyl-CoA dioxygenase family)
MHQDSYYTEPSLQNSFGSAWIPLVDLEDKMGNLILYKKSHLKGKLPIRKLNLKKDPNQDPNANNEETDINPDDFEKIKIRENKGSIIFIHGDAVHSSVKNETNKFRSVLLLTYIRSNSSFRSGNHAKREKVNLSI